jgi:hypothetical protein
MRAAWPQRRLRSHTCGSGCAPVAGVTGSRPDKDPGQPAQDRPEVPPFPSCPVKPVWEKLHRDAVRAAPTDPQTRSTQAPGDTAALTNAGRSRDAAAYDRRRAGAAVSAQSTGRATNQWSGSAEERCAFSLAVVVGVGCRRGREGRTSGGSVPAPRALRHRARVHARAVLAPGRPAA